MTPRFQFSVKVLLLTVAAVSVVLAVTLRVRATIGIPVLFGLTYASIGFVVVALACGNEGLRPFCVGAFVPLACALLEVLSNGSQTLWWSSVAQADTDIYMETPKRILGTALLASIALGYLCVGFHWLIGSREPQNGDDDIVG
ncbi:MAG TPA: hypothetical protein VHC22_20085 [Pirellulales bacterium]|nr:hypothetical protein [Pirellulales bacterium]